MKTYRAKIKSKSPYSQSRYHQTEHLDKEGDDAYERRTWRERMHYDENGEVFIPPMSLKNCLAEAAKFLSVSIKGKGKATYTKHFEAGIMVTTPISLGIKVQDVPVEALFVPSNGRRGGSTRVTRYFGRIPKWSGEFEINVLDETITKDVLELHLCEAGSLIGIGRFRPRNNGYYGRFAVESLEEVVS
jgi:hypothetical protein